MSGSHAANDLILVRESGGYKISSLKGQRPSCLVLVDRGSNKCVFEFNRPISHRTLASEVLQSAKDIRLYNNRKRLCVVFKEERTEGLMRKVVSAAFSL